MMLLRGRRARPRRPPQHVRFSGWTIPHRALSEMAFSASSSAAWGPIAKDGRREREMRVYPSRGDVTRLLLTSDSHFGGLFCVHLQKWCTGGRFRVHFCVYTIFSCRLADVAVHKTRILVYPHIVVYVYTKRANVHKLRTHIDESCVHVHIHIDESCVHVRTHIDASCVHVRTHIDASCVHVRTHIDELCIYTRPPPCIRHPPEACVGSTYSAEAR